MIWDRTNRPLWLRCIVALFAAILAAVIRLEFLGILGFRVTFIIFFPAVALAALYGGFAGGLLATAASAVLADYFWFQPVDKFTTKSFPDIISIVIFLAAGALISYLAEVALRAQARADKAEEQSRLAAERERAEVRLREQRKWFEVTLTSIGDGVLTTDVEGKVTFLNPVAAALVGSTVEEVVGQPVRSVFRIINEKTRAPADDIIERVLTEGNIVALANHTVLVRPDGSEVPIEDSAAPIKDAEGQVSGVVLVFHDVTERRRAQEALTESERHYRSLFENMLNGFAYCKMIFEGDAPKDFIYLGVNSAFETLTGLKNAAGRRVSELIPGIVESDPELFEIYGRVAKTGVPERFETFVEALGQWFSISAYSPVKDHFVAVFDVITERKQAEQYAARLAAIVESSSDAIIGKTPDGKIVSWNRAAETIYGYSAEEAVGRSISVLYPPGAEHELPAILEMIGRSEFVENYETVRRKKNGELIDVSLSISPIRNASGKIAGASTIARDITDRKRMERERDITIELLEVINDNAGTGDLARAAAAFFRKQSGCEAVGIRLKEGDDFPYAEALGFSEEFVQKENSICARDASGDIIRDSSGNPYMECMCGNVLLERIDPSKPFFSPGGSFWTNNSTTLLAAAGDLRHSCNAAGYESVALIQLYLGSERFGILQLNDRRKDMFSPGLIAQWERLAGYLAVAFARSKSEETMRESEERFRVMADSIPQLAWLAKPDGEIYWHNRRWYEYTGTTPELAEGSGWQSVHDPDALPEILARWQESLSSGKAFDMVLPLRGADGNYRQFLTRGEPVRDAQGNVVRWCGTHTDITERRLMEQEIRKSRDELELRVKERTAELERAGEVVKAERKRLYDVLETLPAMISLMTDDYHVAFANRSFREKFGESHGRHCYEYCFGKPEPCDFCESYKVLQTGQPHHWEVTGTDDMVIDAYAFPFTDVDGSQMILEMDLDITQWRRAEAELRSIMEKLEQSNKALQDFASIASHDLQEPLRKVVSFGSMLKRKFEDSLGETGNDYLSRMLDATQRMQSLLKGLLEYSRVTTQANPFTRVDLNKIVGEVLSDLEIRIERAGAEIRVLDLPVITADPVQMRQVFQNLIGNALKFHRHEEQPVVEVRSAVVAGGLEIIIEDNGIGFEDQYIDSIFAPFQRLHGRSSPYAGTGMGLAICKKIVERHGGNITARSAPGEGSAFIIRLPRNQGE